MNQNITQKLFQFLCVYTDLISFATPSFNLPETNHLLCICILGTGVTMKPSNT